MQEPEEVEMDMVSSRYSGLLSLVEMKVLELEHRVLEEPHWGKGVKGSRSKEQEEELKQRVLEDHQWAQGSWSKEQDEDLKQRVLEKPTGGTGVMENRKRSWSTGCWRTGTGHRSAGARSRMRSWITRCWRSRTEGTGVKGSWSRSTEYE